MINYFCDACGKSCDNKYISIKITPDLKHDSRTDTIYAGSNTEEKTVTRLLCPDCLQLINDFVKERAIYNAEKKIIWVISPKKVGFSPFLHFKSGLKKSTKIYEKPLKTMILGIFQPIFEEFYVRLPTCPLLFLINCNKKY